MRFLCLLVAAPLLAQEVEVPVRAAVATGNPAVVRLVIGVPGATVLGDALSSTGSIVAPGHGWAVADTADGVELIRLPDGLSRRPIPGVAAGAGLRAFSANGAALALYHQSTGVVVISGLPNAFETRAAGMPAGAETLAAITVSSDGRRVLAADSAGNVFQWTEAWSPLAGTAGITALELRNGDALLASSDLRLLRQRGDGALQVVAQLPLAPGPRMASSSDEARVLIASADGQSLMVVDLETAVVNQVRLEQAIGGISALRDGEFLLGAEDASGAWSLDRDLKLSFLPAAHR